MFSNEYYKIIILILLYLILSFCFCIGIIIQKYLMEIQFISPFKITFYKGFFGIFGAIIGLIISSNLQCEKEDKESKDLHFFVCSNEYNSKFYYDHFFAYFTNKNIDKVIEPIVLIFYSIFHFCAELSLVLVNKFLSPTHYLITESIYSLIHVPLRYLVNAKYNEIKDELDKGKDISLLNLYDAIINTFGITLLKFVSCIIDFIGYIIYLEIIELKFCGLNKNLRKNIQKRASNDRIR